MRQSIAISSITAETIHPIPHHHPFGCASITPPRACTSAPAFALPPYTLALTSMNHDETTHSHARHSRDPSLPLLSVHDTDTDTDTLSHTTHTRQPSPPPPRHSRLFLQTPQGLPQLDVTHLHDHPNHGTQPSHTSTESTPSFFNSPVVSPLIAFSPTSHISHRSIDDFDLDAPEHLPTNDPVLRRRRHPSFHIEGQPGALAPRSRSIASRSSSSSTRDRTATMPESPAMAAAGSKRSSMIQNRSSIVGPPGTDHAGGWMSGLSEVMASVSSRVVNTRSQEQPPARLSLSAPNEGSETDLSDQQRSAHRTSFHQDMQSTSDAHPTRNSAGSDQGSIKNARRSGSKRSSGSHAGGTNFGARSSQQGNRGPFQGTDYGGESHIGKTNTAIPDKTYQEDEESMFAPGGFTHRGADKMRLEGRSLTFFSPENPLRLWLASILMSK